MRNKKRSKTERAERFGQSLLNLQTLSAAGNPVILREITHASLDFVSALADYMPQIRCRRCIEGRKVEHNGPLYFLSDEECESCGGWGWTYWLITN